MGSGGGGGSVHEMFPFFRAIREARHISPNLFLMLKSALTFGRLARSRETPSHSKINLG